jgi:hypothetical protein
MYIVLVVEPVKNLRNIVIPLKVNPVSLQIGCGRTCGKDELGQ